MFLHIKLTLPEIKGRIIERERLLQLLQENHSKDMILIIADAGYGKTTLVSQWVKKYQQRSVFYSLGEEDSNFDLFLNHIIAGFEQLRPDFLKRTKELVAYNKELKNNMGMVMGTLVNELHEKAKMKYYLILDDYHAIAESSIVHAALQYFIEHLPPMIHMVIASRVLPPFPSMTKWRSKQRIFELAREDMIFTNIEIRNLIKNVYKLALSSSELARIEKYTEGWVTGIQLILQSSGLHRTAIKDTLNGYLEAHQPLFEYFADEVLSYEPQHIQEFLSQCSVLENLTPEACNIIMKKKDSRSLLQKLEQRHLFIFEVKQGEYRFHPLFRRFLNQRLMNSTEFKTLHIRAARYYRKINYYDLSIKHFLMVRQFFQAGKTMLRSIQEDTAGRISGGIDTSLLRKYLDELPHNILSKLPELMVIKGTLLRDTGAHEQAKELYSSAEIIARGENNMTAGAHSLAEKALLNWLQGKHNTALVLLQKALRTCPLSSRKMKLHILNLLGLVWQDLSDLPKAKIYLRKAKKLAADLNILYDEIILESNLATISLQEGEIKHAYAICKPLLALLGEHYYYKVGVIYANAARAALDYGDIAWAESCLQQGWSICRLYDDRVSSGTLNHCYGLLFMYQEQWHTAHAHFQEAQQVFHILRWRRMESSVLRNVGTLFRLQGKKRESLKTIEQAERLLNDPTPQKTAHAAFLLADRALLQVDQGDYAGAQKTITQCLRKARKKKWQLGEMYSLLVKALAAVYQNNTNKAKQYIDGLLSVTEEKGYHGILALELKHKPKLVGYMEKLAFSRSYLENHHITSIRPKLFVSFFGGLRLEDMDHRTIPLTWPTAKTKSLFAFLIIHRVRSLTRAQVLDALWSGMNKKKAHENMRTTAYRMRQTLKHADIHGIAADSIFTIQRGQYILLPEITIDSDIDEFIRVMKMADIAQSNAERKKAYERAITINCESFLPEIYDQWVDAQRAILHEQRCTALHQLIIIAQNEKNDTACATYCKQYLLYEQLSEEIG